MGLIRAARDLAAETRGHAAMSRQINAAIAAGDTDAADVFHTTAPAAVLTRKGLDARGEEVQEYARRVHAADGNMSRFHRLFRD